MEPEEILKRKFKAAESGDYMPARVRLLSGLCCTGRVVDSSMAGNWVMLEPFSEALKSTNVRNRKSIKADMISTMVWPLSEDEIIREMEALVLDKALSQEDACTILGML